MQLHGLKPGVTYFYGVVAENQHGIAEAAQTVDTFTTLPSAVGVLPDNRAWELVSPPEKGGAGVEAIGGAAENNGPTGGAMQASEDGNAVTYVTDGPIGPAPEGSRSPEGTQVISSRSAEGWSSKDVVTPHSRGEGFPSGKPQEYQLFSSDLSLALLEPWGLTPLQEPPLVPAVTEEERGVYIRSNATCQAVPATCYQPVVTSENDTAKEKFGGAVGIVQGGGVLSATSDLRHVVFGSEVPLTTAKPSAPGLYEWSAEKSPAEQLQLISVLPNGKALEEAAGVALGDHVPQGTVARDAISKDGSRIFWTNEGDRLYMRDTVKGQTLQINTPAPGVRKLPSEEAERAEEVHFQLASSDGSKVFFTDTVALTAQSSLEPMEGGPADLYECEVVETGGELLCSLTDLTVDPHAEFGERAEVVGKMLGASEDGSSIYFVANGALAPGAVAGNCLARPRRVGSTAATCSLYREHYDGKRKEWESPRFIATLSEEDKPDWGALTPRARWAASRPGSRQTGATWRSCPTGRLTGYDNVDTNPAAKGARDEEVFLYDSEQASSSYAHRATQQDRRTGSSTAKVRRRARAARRPPGNWTDKPEIAAPTATGWPGASPAGRRWLSEQTPPCYQSRYLSDSGRLFFNSADALVTQDSQQQTGDASTAPTEVGVEDVYQYEPAASATVAAHGLRLADLLGERPPRIGVPGRELERQRRVLRDRRSAGGGRPRQQLRRV